MKRLKKRLVIGAVAATAAFAAASCGRNQNEAVYGPPEDFEQEDPQYEEEPEQEDPHYEEEPEQEEETGELRVDWDGMEDNENEAVYGPPEDLGWELDHFDPDANENEDVYGPPPEP